MGEHVNLKPGEARCDAPSYQDILDKDSKEAPASLRAQSAPFLGDEAIPAAHYTSQEFFDQEVEKMWTRTWQMACREEEIPEVGDYMTYDIVGKSFLIVRTKPDEIKSYYNSCLHRGTKLKHDQGCANQFRCPFHGFTWNLDGSFKSNPTQWDFPHLSPEKLQLPETLVDTWGGFVFINMDLNARPLYEVLDILPEHFERWKVEDCYKSIHVAKVIKANWKVVSEAFMESWHTIDTHPQIMPYLACANSQYDVFTDHITRQISATGEPSPHVYDKNYSEQEILNSMTATSGRVEDDSGLKVPDGQKARAFMAEVSRQAFTAEDGHDYSDKSDAEMLDALLYNVFPNLSVWAGFPPNLVYRWRPNGRDVNSAIMEVMWLKRCPKGKPRPEPVPVHWLTEDQKWTDAEELGGLADIFEQDMGNLPFVQEGLHASGTGEVHFGNYQEMRIRQHHITLKKYLNDEY